MSIGRFLHTFNGVGMTCVNPHRRAGHRDMVHSQPVPGGASSAGPPVA